MSSSASRLTRIDPASNAVAARIAVKPANPCPAFPATCGEVAAGQGAVWVSVLPDNTVLRVDPGTNSVTATIPVGAQPDGVATSPGAVWVANHGDPGVSGAPSVSRIDPATNSVVATISVGPKSACCNDHMAVTTGAGAVWVTIPNRGVVVRIDPKTNKVVATIKVSKGSSQPCGFVAVSEAAVWVAGAHCGGTVTRIDPRTNEPEGTVTGLSAPIGLGLAFGFVWVSDLDAKAIARIDVRTRRVVGRLPVGGFPVRLSVGLGSVWVRDDTGRVLRIDAQS
jgi:virginiamycin B lyase